MELTLGFSPCPNDTFIFDAMVNGLIDTQGLTFKYQMEDVETLNQMAELGTLDITKLSYSTFLHTVNQYALLHSGSALGKGVGPLLVAKTNLDTDTLSTKSIAIPGLKTTANLLLTLAYPTARQKTEVVFSDIEDAVLDGRFDAGLVIHESRFTYASKGLVKLADLGEWWELATGAAIPLGGIVIKRQTDRKIQAAVDGIIKESITYAWHRYPELSPFIRNNAQEMDETVMRKHIDLYVNEFTTDLGEIGRKAIHTLFEKAKEGGLLSGGYEGGLFY